MLRKGARGVVWKAWDTRLERNVALKLLPGEAFAGGEDSAEQARLNLVREAQATARITHDNVLTVFDAGTHGEEVYVAMELVEGQTLTTWLAQPHRWREIVSVFVQAGSGLRAAHAQGIFHCAFKPDNVLVGEDGRVYVADFGLGEVAAARDGQSSEPAGAAADQFDFCAALYRALYGQAPFDGETPQRARDPPGGSPVGARVRQAIMRGLERRPENRHPSMAALLDALGQQVPPGRRPTLGLVAVLLVGAGLIAAVVTEQYRERSQVCRGGAARMDTVWSPAMSARVRGTFARTGHPGADAIAGRLDDVINGFRRRWTELYTEACEATAVRREQSAELLDRKMACLEARRGSAAAIVEVFLTADREVVNRAITVAPRAAELEVCSDNAALLVAYPPPDKSRAAAVADIGSRLDRVDAFRKAGRYRLALDTARAATAQAHELAYPPLVARALFILAETQMFTDAQAAEPLYGEAEQAAARARDDRLLALVFARHISILSAKLGRTDAALALRPAAEAAVVRGPQDRLVQAALAHSLGAIYNAIGDLVKASEQLERTVTLRRAVLGDDHPDVALAKNNLGIVLTVLHRSAGARQILESALATNERAFGTEDHPEVARSLGALATTYSYEGRFREARSLYERAIRIYDRVYGPGSPDAADPSINLGVDFFRQCQFAEAARTQKAVLYALDKHRGTNNVGSLFALTNLGGAQLESSQYSQAEQTYREALARKSAGAGAEGMHPELGRALTGLANVSLARGRATEALGRAREAAVFADRRLAKTSLDRAAALTTLGRALVAVGRPREARPILEEAIKMVDHTQEYLAPYLVEGQFALAQVLWRTGGDRRRALELARHVHNVITASCPRPRLVPEVERFLAL
jgi:tetratricopeptide (TPR) repeat protein